MNKIIFLLVFFLFNSFSLYASQRATDHERWRIVERNHAGQKRKRTRERPALKSVEKQSKKLIKVQPKMKVQLFTQLNPEQRPRKILKTQDRLPLSQVKKSEVLESLLEDWCQNREDIAQSYRHETFNYKDNFVLSDPEEFNEVIPLSLINHRDWLIIKELMRLLHGYDELSTRMKKERDEQMKQEVDTKRKLSCALNAAFYLWHEPMMQWLTNYWQEINYYAPRKKEVLLSRDTQTVLARAIVQPILPQLVQLISKKFYITKNQRGDHFPQSIFSCAVNESQSLCVVGYERGNVGIWDKKLGTLTIHPGNHDRAVPTIKWMPGEERKFITFGTDNRINYWHYNEAHDSWDVFAQEEDELFGGFSFAINQSHFAIALADGSIELRDRKKETKETIPEQHLKILDLNFSLDGRLLASGGNDRKVKIWDIENKLLVKELKDHQSQVMCVQFGTQWFATGADDKKINIYQMSDWQQLRSLKIHKQGIWSVKFTQDDKLLISGSRDHSICVTDVASGVVLKRINKAHSSDIHQIDLQADTLISVGREGLIKQWDIARFITMLEATKKDISNADIDINLARLLTRIVKTNSLQPIKINRKQKRLLNKLPISLLKALKRNRTLIKPNGLPI